MTAEKPVLRQHGNPYNIFVLVLTIFSLAVMGVLLLPVDQDTRDLLTFYDNVICAIFLADFLYNLAGARPKRAYFVGGHGWLDLLGSVPSLPGFPYTSILRLARLGRLGRIAKLLSGKNRKELVADVLGNRGQYATFITILSAGIVLVTASILVLQFESAAGDEANIQNGADALWWSVVTITTVGYGDRFPVTFLGRITGVSLMVVGIGIIGALASILASLLVAPSPAGEPAEAPPPVPAPAAPPVPAPAVAAAAPAPPPAAAAPALDGVTEELARLREEIAALRADLGHGSG
jgi:voltage-gated potassium channel